jgi:hypothetical protein
MSFASDAWVFESESSLSARSCWARGPGSREDVEVVHVVAPRSKRARSTHPAQLPVKKPNFVDW